MSGASETLGRDTAASSSCTKRTKESAIAADSGAPPMPLSSSQLISLLELAEEYTQLQLALKEELQDAIFKLAAARRSSSMGSVGSAAYRQTADDLREDNEPALTVLVARKNATAASAASSTAYELHYDDSSAKNALFMMNGLPPPALKKAQALFRGCAATAVRLASLSAQMDVVGAAAGAVAGAAR